MGLTYQWKDPDEYNAIDSWLGGGGIGSVVNNLVNHLNNNLHGISSTGGWSNSNSSGFTGIGGQYVTTTTTKYKDWYDQNGNYLNTQVLSETSETFWVWDEFSFSGKAAQRYYKRLTGGRGGLSGTDPSMIMKYIAWYIRTTKSIGGMRNPFYNAVAIFGDAGGTLFGQELDKGLIFVLAGEDAGLITDYREVVKGVGTDLGIGLEFGAIFMLAGDVGDLKVSDFGGHRWKVYGGIELYGTISVGGGYQFARPRDRNWLMVAAGVQGGIGVSVLQIFGIPLYGGYNQGDIIINSNGP